MMNQSHNPIASRFSSDSTRPIYLNDPSCWARMGKLKLVCIQRSLHVIGADQEYTGIESTIVWCNYDPDEDSALPWEYDACAGFMRHVVINAHTNKIRAGLKRLGFSSETITQAINELKQYHKKNSRSRHHI